MVHYIDTKTIIINLLKADERMFLPINRLQELIRFIYAELSKKNQTDNYHISFDINFDSIERTVLYNNSIFYLDMNGKMIYLCESESAEALAQRYRTDDTITHIIEDFKSANAV